MPPPKRWVRLKGARVGLLWAELTLLFLMYEFLWALFGAIKRSASEGELAAKFQSPPANVDDLHVKVVVDLAAGSSSLTC